MDRRTAREALRLLEAHQSFVKATIVRATGSVPGKLGATMIVRADGTTVGTVGGAALEEEVKRLAAVAIERRGGDLAHFDLAAWKQGGLPSLCGGSVDVALEFVPARPNLLLWGGGHVAEAVARLLPTLEYDYSVADDRPEFVGRDRFPDADRREVVDPGRVFDTFDPAEFTHLLLLGYDALKDLEVLDEAIRRFPNTIGLIASASKREHIYARLRERGVGREALARVRSPVGLPIGAETPTEIAVSVVAEIVRDVHPPSLGTPTRAVPTSASESDVVRRSR
ncbi:MAG TPA: XdhC/CoxI family protein [Thermoplasmata archaeon]|nr:XdhC/CoxI family protein [Thermoplasmata archaeon]